MYKIRGHTLGEREYRNVRLDPFSHTTQVNRTERITYDFSVDQRTAPPSFIPLNDRERKKNARLDSLQHYDLNFSWKAWLRWFPNRDNTHSTSVPDKVSVTNVNCAANVSHNEEFSQHRCSSSFGDSHDYQMGSDDQEIQDYVPERAKDMTCG